MEFTYCVGFVPGQLLRSKPAEEESVTSLVLHTLGLATYLFTLTQDCKLKMWSCDRQECIMVANLLDMLNMPKMQQGVPEPGRQNHMLRKAVGRDENDLHIGIFLSFARKSAFLIVKPVSEQGYFDLNSLIAVSDLQISPEVS
jgi:Nucleoporin Nup120/160